MNSHFKNIIDQATGATSITKTELIQSLWSGYGEISRYGLSACDSKSIVVKHVKLPDQNNHPRGWNTDISHQRKIKSYQIEMAWYKQWSTYCDNLSRVPHCLALESKHDEVLIVLEDLNDSDNENNRFHP